LGLAATSVFKALIYRLILLPFKAMVSASLDESSPVLQIETALVPTFGEIPPGSRRHRFL
jgi:hypothetical protein